MGAFKTAEEEVSALTRRIMLMEEEAKKADSSLAETVTKLALASKDADGILKKVKYFESETMNSEVEIEEADKNLRETTRYELREAFRIYDKHKQGYISTDVLKEILREIDTDLNEEELEEIVTEVDEDNSGTVDFREFMNMMTGE